LVDDVVLFGKVMLTEALPDTHLLLEGSPFTKTLRFGGLSYKRLKGLEPSTFCMASRRSSQLSYSRAGAEYSPLAPGRRRPTLRGGVDRSRVSPGPGARVSGLAG
jgi:hypothetical protein